MKKIITATLFFACLTILFTSCKKETGVELNDEEIITDVQLTFINQLNGASSIFNYQDADGPGGMVPTQDSILLDANANYKLSIKLFNKTVTPIEDITLEVIEEAEAHRFYFIPSSNTISINTTDVDGNGVPLGLQSNVTTTSTGAGNLRVILRHYPGTPPNKQISDLENNTKSGSDIDVTFGFRVR